MDRAEPKSLGGTPNAALTSARTDVRAPHPASIEHQ